MKLRGKVAAITGGGSGMGAATAALFAREGAAVVVADIDGDAAERVAASIRSGGGQAAAVRADVTRLADNRAIVAAARERFGRLDVFHANAGIPQRYGPFEGVAEEAMDRLLAVNVKGVMLGVQAALPALRAAGGGVILFTASTAAHRPRPGLTAYNATKGALITLCKSLALELAPDGIRVNCISPVATDTPMLADFIGDRDPEAGRRAFIQTIPLGRLNTPEDVARAALFLASDDAAMITGISLEVDGGRDI